jgi:hypothetical protein
MLHTAFKHSLRFVFPSFHAASFLCRNPLNLLTENLFPFVFNSMGQRRFQSTSTTFLTKGSTKSFKKAWLSDSSTYPLIVVMGAAAALVGGVGGSCILYSPE